ncbi:3829_t:CDS:2 [Ambispora gerdemannii]|uniref:3829_t:CDS:1 n=1 Tax=Ambispora gerdemannii TaxID=144530 RepID=A0A9N9DTY3_9GLOM|nr:3829_t:CDS:2 [Ambispora gerdemannii]
MSILEDINANSCNYWLLLTIFFMISYVTQFYFRYFTRESPLPGPIPIPIFSNILQMRSDPAIYANKMQKKYGDMWEIYMGSERHVYLGRVDLIEKMMSSSSKTNFFQKGSKNEGLVELGL